MKEPRNPEGLDSESHINDRVELRRRPPHGRRPPLEPQRQYPPALQASNSNLDFIPGMMDIKNIHETENHIGTHFLWTYKMAGLRFEGETTVLEWVKNKRVVTQSKGGINSKWFFTYESIDNGTALSLVVEYDVPIPVIGKIAEAVIRKQNEREAELALSNIKARMEL